MRRLSGCIGLALLIQACGGGGGSSTAPSPTPQPDPVAPDPSPAVPDPLFPPVPANTSCSGLDYLKLIDASSENTSTMSSSSNQLYGASLAIDGLLGEESRWETSDTSPVLTLDLGYRHLVKEIGTAWYLGGERLNTFDIEVSEDGETYQTIIANQSTQGTTSAFERFNIEESVVRFIKLTSYGGSNNDVTALSEFAVFGCPLDVAVAPTEPQTVDISQFGLDTNVPPGSNFDLETWALDTPRTDPDDGFSLRASERELRDGFVDDDYFYTAADGGMVFVSTIFGAKTSANTSFTRSELREMLRRGNTGISTQGTSLNNWVLGYQPEPQSPVGGRAGVLTATLKIDKVTVAGSNSHEGRVIVGQIHADDDEPVRLYYKKFADNDKGYFYFAHELRGGDDKWITVVGRENANRDNQPIYRDEPDIGIALGEIFSYEIIQQGQRIDVIIRRGDLTGPIIGHNYVDMVAENSGYDIAEEWMYFKAGAYSQNNTGDSGDENGVGSDFDQVTFYHLLNSH